jgi:hypothetical protein
MAETGPATAATREPAGQAAGDGPHIAVQQLVPRLGECLRELVRVLVEAPGDRPVDGVRLQRMSVGSIIGGCRLGGS